MIMFLAKQNLNTLDCSCSTSRDYGFYRASQRETPDIARQPISNETVLAVSAGEFDTKCRINQRERQLYTNKHDRTKTRQQILDASS